MSGPSTNKQEPARYELRVGGHLDDHWSAWFGGSTLTRESDGTTTLRGPVVDQAALHGLLVRIRDLGVELISVQAVSDPRHGHCPDTNIDGGKIMKAITQAEFGSADVLEFSDVPQPDPGPGEVLVRVGAASPNPWDWHFMRGRPYISRLAGAGLRTPKNLVLGSDVSGEVQAVGAGTTRFRPGDEVSGFVGAGAFAEYVTAPAGFLASKPANVTHEQAATIPLAGMTALQGLRDVGEVRAGQRVLIIGASGGVGSFAVQIAKSFGAVVTGVCSTRNVELVRSMGADHVIDYTREDVTKLDQAYEVIFQLAGTTSPGAFRRILTPSGRLVLSSGDSTDRFLGPLKRMIKASVMSAFIGQTLRPLTMKRSSEDLDFLRELVEGGSLTPIIERTYALSASAEAIRYLETGRVRGKLAISVRPDQGTATGR